ncbi:hypothetical protein ACFL04_04615 [Patescibacteria group bacterium]
MPLPQKFEQKETKKTLEVPVIPERREVSVTKKEQLRTVEQPEELEKSIPAKAPPTAVPATSLEHTVREVEIVLAENLDDIYKNLPAEKQVIFRKKGEETARKISVMIIQAKVKVGGILSLIKKWLKIVPGINKFFLEQEAKIKTDKLVNYYQQNKEQQK